MTLYGREAECVRLDEVLAARGASALLLRGGAGSGKTALLGYAAEHAADRRLLRASGVEAETDLPYAGLHQLIGLTAPSGDRLRAGLALLDALVAASERGPLLCIVDDAHLLDKASIDALTFVIRRLSEEPIVLLLAADERFATASLPELPLPALDREAAGRWLDDRFGEGLSPLVRDRLLRQAKGNPLALVELANALSAEQLAGRRRLPDPLPVATRVMASLVPRLRDLDSDARRILLVAAATDAECTGGLRAAAEKLGAGSRELDALETSGLIRTTGDRFAFEHPLLRSAAYHSATDADRRAAHAALADVTEGDDRAWHRAAATLGTDAEAADELERAADDTRRRRGFTGAADALERAAALTPAFAPARVLRLAAAADAAHFAGETARASALFGEALRSACDPRLRAALAAARRADPFRDLRTRLAKAADVQVIVAELRDEGAVGALPVALQRLAFDDLVAGRFSSAETNASEGLRLARLADLPDSAARHHGFLAWIAAVRGSDAEGRAHARVAFEHQPELATAALGELELGLGRHASALTQFRLLRLDDDSVVRLVAPSIVEAATRADDRSLAEQVMDRYESTGSAHPGLLERGRALLAEGQQADARFAAALLLHKETGRAFDQARTELLYGEALRRTRRRREARAHLQAALDLFDKLGAESWASRARTELRGSGLTAQRGDPSLLDQLTQQELQVARLVGAGATNKEVAAQLFLSPRTIDFHLRNIFAKLGITSRTQLAWFRPDDEYGGFAGASLRAAA